jgi:hypothetical protein
MHNSYVPGTCNIGKEEIKKRRDAAITATIVAVVITVSLELMHANKLWRLLIFLPLVSAGIGIQQWYFKFCVRFGLNGIFNFNDLGKTDTVEQAEMRKLDKAKATKMIVTSILVALILTAAFYLFD